MDTAKELLFSLPKRARVSGQIPELAIEFGPSQNLEAAPVPGIQELISRGDAAWKVSRPVAGIPAVIYGSAPVNPKTKR